MKHIYGTTVARKKVKAGREDKVKEKRKKNKEGRKEEKKNPPSRNPKNKQKNIMVLLFLPWINILLFLFVLA